MRVLLLGPFEIRDGDDQPVELAGARLRALVARLALEAGREVTADALLYAIWEDDAPSANALQALVSRVRRAIGAERLARGAAGYRLAVEPGDVDVVRFQRLAETGRRQGDLAALREAESLWRGAALADLRQLRFADNEAVRLERLRNETVRERLALEVATGTDVLGELEPFAAANPLDERWQALLMRALYATGRPAEALDAYERTRERLADELGADPSPELADLHLQILRQSAAPPARAEKRTNLKAQLTSFVGRETDLEALIEAVAASRLVTVTGPGGAGKTRLVVEAAARIANAGSAAPQGIWMAELASAADSADVAPAVLRAIGAREAGMLEPSAHDAASRLEEYFAGQDALLILDNCEHRIDAAAELAARLLGACPGLRIIATSREALAIGGERLYPIPPLALSTEDPESSPAVRLFAERAVAVRPDFELNALNIEAVVEICRRLDGLPLAVELAAARMRALDAAQIAARLDDRFALLAGADRTAPARHRTLEAVIAWSWELLSDPERALSMRIAAYPGGVALDRTPDLDALAGLIDKSLVERDGERYRMLETVRSYALARLEESGNAAAEYAVMQAFCLELTERSEPELRATGQLDAIARLTAEHDNLVAAIGRAVDQGDNETGLRMVAVLFWYWHLRGLRTEFHHWIGAVLSVPGEVPERLRPAARILAGMLASEKGDFAAGEAAISEGIALGRKLDRDIPGRFLMSMGPAFTAAPPIVDEPGLDGWELGAALLISAVGTGIGADAESLANVARAEEVFEQLGERWGLASTLRVKAEQLARCGDLEGSEQALAEAARLFDELGTLGDAAETYAELAVSIARNGAIEKAWAAWEQGVARTEVDRDPRVEAYVRWSQVQVLVCERRYSAALEALAPAEQALRGTVLEDRMRVLGATFRDLIPLLQGERPPRAIAALPERALGGAADADIAMAASVSAAIAFEDGDAALAARLLGSVFNLLGEADGRGYDAPLRTGERVREALGDKEFEAEHARGRDAGRDAATNLLLGL